MENKFYEQKLFKEQKLFDYRNLKENPLYVHLKKGKTDEGYYLGLYIDETPNEFSVKINSLTSYCNEFRKHDWFFNDSKKDLNKRLHFIQALLDI